MSVQSVSLKPFAPSSATSQLSANVANPMVLKVWNAIGQGTSVQIDGAVVNSPTPMKPPNSTSVPSTDGLPKTPDPLPPSEGFIVEGNITVFGLLEGSLRSWHGPPPASVGTVSASTPPVFQQAMLNAQHQVSDLLPGVAGTMFKYISLQNVLITYQNYIL